MTYDGPNDNCADCANGYHCGRCGCCRRKRRIARALAAAAAVVALTAALAPAAYATTGPTNNPFNIWEKFGSSYAVGAASLTPGTAAIATEHPGRTLHWFPVSGTYMGNQNGNITTSNGLLLAATNDCGNATLKSDPNALGTVWTFKVESGDLVVINRRCDQAAGSPNTFSLALTGSTHAGDKWLLSSSGFRAVLTPGA